MALYITTSRKPSATTRRLAKWLARLLHGESENRGKRSVSEIMERAENAGLDGVLVIGESHGNPSKLSFIRGGEWRESILLKSLEMPAAAEKERKRFPKIVVGKAGDKTGEKILELFGVEGGGEENNFVAVEADSKEICFSAGVERVGPVLKILGLSKE